jgi:murein L,D-transpeptidase YafK
VESINKPFLISYLKPFILSTVIWGTLNAPSGALAEVAAPSEFTSGLPKGLISLSSHPQFSKYAFLVDKQERILKVYELDGPRVRLVAEHPADIGKRAGDKEKENDYKTPEGIYFLQQKITQPEIPFELYGSRAFTTDYPNIFDKRLSKGGSGIWLHAIPDSVPLTRGSRGCVVVRNEVIQKLEQFIQLGQTPLLIFDRINYVSKEEFDQKRTLYLNFIEQWRTAWETSDADSYIKFYDETFRNDQMNFRQWYRYKKKLKNTYKFIRVSFSEPVVLWNRNQVVIRLMQKYTSNVHEDFGEKTLHAVYSEKNGFKIVREDWRSASLPNTEETESSSVYGLPSSSTDKDVRKTSLGSQL